MGLVFTSSAGGLIFMPLLNCIKCVRVRYDYNPKGSRRVTKMNCPRCGEWNKVLDDGFYYCRYCEGCNNLQPAT